MVVLLRTELLAQFAQHLALEVEAHHGRQPHEEPLESLTVGAHLPGLPLEPRPSRVTRRAAPELLRVEVEQFVHDRGVEPEDDPDDVRIAYASRGGGGRACDARTREQRERQGGEDEKPDDEGNEPHDASGVGRASSAGSFREP
jgi:hypothetical protein